MKDSAQYLKRYKCKLKRLGPGRYLIVYQPNKMPIGYVTKVDPLNWRAAIVYECRFASTIDETLETALLVLATKLDFQLNVKQTDSNETRAVLLAMSLVNGSAPVFRTEYDQ